ncbi:MAG: hypothetical protein ACJAVZ_000913 [Afipia broomeae]|jgi:hypothetical protein
MPYEWDRNMDPPLFIRVCGRPETTLSCLHAEDRNIVNVEKPD